MVGHFKQSYEHFSEDKVNVNDLYIIDENLTFEIDFKICLD